MGNGAGKKIRAGRLIVQLVVLAAVIAGVLVLARIVSENEMVQEAVQQFGYFGVFVISVLSGFNLAVPIPAVTFLPLFTAVGLSFWLIVVVMTLGMTTGDSIGFFVGRAGRKLTESRSRKVRESKIYRYLVVFSKRHRLWPYVFLTFYAAFAPAPNELVVIPMAFMGYRFRFMIPIVFIGNFVFNTLVAFGVTGITQLF